MPLKILLIEFKESSSVLTSLKTITLRRLREGFEFNLFKNSNNKFLSISDIWPRFSIVIHHSLSIFSAILFNSSVAVSFVLIFSSSVTKTEGILTGKILDTAPIPLYSLSNDIGLSKKSSES